MSYAEDGVGNRRRTMQSAYPTDTAARRRDTLHIGRMLQGWVDYKYINSANPYPTYGKDHQNMDHFSGANTHSEIRKTRGCPLQMFSAGSKLGGLLKFSSTRVSSGRGKEMARGSAKVEGYEDEVWGI